MIDSCWNSWPCNTLLHYQMHSTFNFLLRINTFATVVDAF